MSATNSRFEKYTVVQLKQILKNNHLTVSGNKSVLIKRLEEHYKDHPYGPTLASKTISKSIHKTTPESTSIYKPPILPITDAIQKLILKHSINVRDFRSMIKALMDNMNIPALAFRINTSHEDITFNDKNNFATAITHNTTTNTVNLDIDIDDIIADGLRGNRSIKNLTIHVSNIKTLKSFIPQNLENLYIIVQNSDNNAIVHKFVNKFVKHVKSNTTLQKLIIEDFTNYYYDVNMVLNNVLSIFNNNLSIRYLQISVKNLKFLEHSITSIVNSNISQLHIHYGLWNVDTYTLLINSLIDNKHITHLSINGHHQTTAHDNGINDDTLSVAFEQLFSKNYTIEHVSFNQPFKNAIGYGIVKGLEKNRSIRMLDMHGNMFSEEIYVLIANIISHSDVLNVVKLESVLLGRKDIDGAMQSPYHPDITLDMVEEAFAKALINNNSLVVLEIKHNQFTTGSIFDALKHNSSLKTLDLKYNQFKDNVVDHIIDMIVSNTSLTSIDISNAPHQYLIDGENINKILKFIEYHPNIVHFKIGYQMRHANVHNLAYPFLQRNIERQQMTSESLVEKLLTML